jgi:hypothetical protein
MLSHGRDAIRSLALTIGLALCSTVGCNHPTEPVELWLRVEPTQARYAPGDSVNLVISNIGAAPIGTTACGSSIERLDGGRWVDLGPSDRDCGDVAFLIDVGQSRVLAAGVLPRSLGAGTYRFRIPEARTAQGPLQIVPDSQLASAPLLVEPP